eukprot:CAMPEP_0117665120 /NCGR_PEP_ID=MMETSP0804-20121206/9628_1 /TAXON_ID=1074897 /ORGANISM="Tetraselmis astigmatica, Strain CCMP880" /LENGTH=307 /DNA_ID=CAMNT_0005472487 /DNA_START=283 /DNA_END=1206 /DNA_ORIENTATION=+
MASGSSDQALLQGHHPLNDSPLVSGEATKTPPATRAPRKKGVAWTEEEHKLFLLGLRKLGKGDWRGISWRFVRTRTPTQVASHAQKYFLRQSANNKRKKRSSLFDLTEEDTTDGEETARQIYSEEGSRSPCSEEGHLNQPSDFHHGSPYSHVAPMFPPSSGAFSAAAPGAFYPAGLGGLPLSVSQLQALRSLGMPYGFPQSLNGPSAPNLPVTPLGVHPFAGFSFPPPSAHFPQPGAPSSWMYPQYSCHHQSGGSSGLHYTMSSSSSDGSSVPLPRASAKKIYRPVASFPKSVGYSRVRRQQQPTSA